MLNAPEAKFTQLSALGYSNAQRKILEDLQLKKQMILKQGVSQALSAPATSQQPTVSNYEHLIQSKEKHLDFDEQKSPGWSSGTDGHIAGNSQRSSLLQATSSSFGYFIPQDSSFGNFILPVLPRLEPK
ncbi:SOSS complex subunit C homolog [Penaeus monodon]|uniref:SOSS complex subunit C homolog n=1 Tax=Penaeus monodon TaxID=6687 RepID=UPI0018A7C2F7|nr:SOSS complex subunit C homolog [Penaeus monodon]